MKVYYFGSTWEIHNNKLQCNYDLTILSKVKIFAYKFQMQLVKCTGICKFSLVCDDIRDYFFCL